MIYRVSNTKSFISRHYRTWTFSNFINPKISDADSPFHTKNSLAECVHITRDSPKSLLSVQLKVNFNTISNKISMRRTSRLADTSTRTRTLPPWREEWVWTDRHLSDAESSFAVTSQMCPTTTESRVLEMSARCLTKPGWNHWTEG